MVQKQKITDQSLLMNTDVKILKQDISQKTQQNILKIKHRDQMEFIPGTQRWHNTGKFLSIIHRIYATG